MIPSRAYDGLNAMERMAEGGTFIHRLDARSKIFVTLVYLILLLSVDIYHLPVLLLMGLFPILTTIWAGIPPSFILKRAVWVLPFALFIGIFNPILDRQPALYIAGYPVSGGWLSFASIIVRSFFAVWMALLLISTTGFYKICSALRRMKVPSVITTQLLLTYRYVFVLIAEASRMLLAKSLRNGQSKRTPLAEWSSLAGNLLLRSVDKSTRLYRALLARGFDGEIVTDKSRLQINDYGYIICSTLFLVVLRFGNTSDQFGRILERLLL